MARAPAPESSSSSSVGDGSALVVAGEVWLCAVPVGEIPVPVGWVELTQAAV